MSEQITVNESSKKDELLPARPGEQPIKKEIKGTIFAFYINGELVQTSKQEALNVMSQILNILTYIDEQENKQ
jgi:hypothetical protein